MENRCSVLGCLSTSDDGVQLHEFPFNDKLLLPLWIMATNRSNWLPIDKSRICDKHFGIDDHKAGDKGNMLRPDACPIFQVTNGNNITQEKLLTDSEDSECSSTSDINSDDLLDTPNTSDMKSSDDDSTPSSSSCSNFSNSNEATGFDDDFLSSLSDTEFELENIDIEESMLEADSVSLSSSVTSFTNQPINLECAVVLCNENARNQFDTLFFINFPKENIPLSQAWWITCGHKEKFDPLAKICSIHFQPDDFISITVRRAGQLFRQTSLKNDNVVPSLYLLPHEYTKFARKRKRSVNNGYSIQNNSTAFEYCIIQGCDKTFVKDGKHTLFFKFPLDNKPMLKKWVDNIELTNWQPTVTDRICSDHFENDDVLMTNDIYSLKSDAIPSIMPQNSFVISSEDNYDRKRTFTDNRKYIDIIFNNLEFDRIEENTLIVKDIIREKKNESLLINSLENDLDDQEPKNQKQFFNTSTVQSSSTKINRNKGIPESIIYNQDLTECYGEMLPPYCDEDCQLICYYSMPGPDRRQIYKEFKMLNVTEQNCKITQLVQLRMSKKKDSTFVSCPTYRFIWNKVSVKVCRTFFMNTLGISDNRLDAILKPINYSWYSDRDTALKANQPRQPNVISEPVVMTDFMKESLIPLDKDYNAYEPDSDSEVSLENVPFKEYEKVFLYMKGIPRVLSSYQMPGTLKKHFFETSICLEYMYKTYSESYIRNNTPPPYTKRQFKKIYNQYMKTFLKMV